MGNYNLSKIGFTTTIPVEIVFAAGLVPVDLNNVFITAEKPAELVDQAELDGFPRNTCSWIKGIYTVVQNLDDIDTVIAVVEGDCSNSRALMEVLDLKGVKCVPFSYPHSQSYDKLEREILSLCDFFDVSIGDCFLIKKDLDSVRKNIAYLDELTWKYNKAGGFENHIWQVQSSDFNGNYNMFDKQLKEMISKIEKRKQNAPEKRIGYIGVPPIYPDIYDFIEGMSARVVFNEVQRQFTMVHGICNNDLTEVYRQFTYPYGINVRLRDIKKEIRKRNIDGIIHYVQSFCFRGIEDVIIRDKLDVPVLTLEGDKPGSLDARNKLRLEAFIEMC